MCQKRHLKQFFSKSIFFSAFILFLFLIVITPSLQTQAASKTKLSTNKITLVKGQKKSIKIKGTKKRPVWSVKNKKIAAIKKNGKYGVNVTAKKKGSTYIYAKVNNKKYKCKIIVETPVLKTTATSLNIGQTYTLKVTGTKQKISYKSGNSKIATVNKNGIITAIAKGNTTITATLSCGKKYTCNITVTAPASPSLPIAPSNDTKSADAGEYSIGQVHSGDGTYYDGGYIGGCANLDAIAGDYYVAAINKTDYRAGHLAGAYLKVTGPHGTINVLITDTLADGEGQKGDIDLNKEAFAKIEPLVTGRMKVNWEIIPLPTTKPIQYVYKPTSSKYWMQVQVRNHRYPVKKLEILDSSGKFSELPREEYNYFTLNNPGAGPYTFRVTDIYGHILVDKNVPLSPNTAINGGANFPY